MSNTISKSDKKNIKNINCETNGMIIVFVKNGINSWWIGVKAIVKYEYPP